MQAEYNVAGKKKRKVHSAFLCMLSLKLLFFGL